MATQLPILWSKYKAKNRNYNLEKTLNQLKKLMLEVLVGFIAVAKSLSK